MGGEGQILKRIPRIKFPRRHPKSSASGQSQLENSGNKDVNRVSFSSSDVRPLPRNTSVGGKATLQPKRTPLSDEEIEAILLSETDVFVQDKMDTEAVHVFKRGRRRRLDAGKKIDFIFTINTWRRHELNEWY